MSATAAAENGEWDYVIVGAGSAGCVLAARLSQARFTVLLLEAGGEDKGRWLNVPLGVGKVSRDDRYVWPFRTEADEGTMNRRMYWPRGKLLGGSGSVSGAIWSVGLPHRYDEWAADGCPGWDWRTMEPVLRRCEAYADPTAPGRGHGGPIAVEELRGDHPVTDGFIAACQQVGIPFTPDYNGPDPEGVGRLQLSTRRGVGCSSATGYLRPAMARPNLRVQTDTVVETIVFEGRRAAAVAFVRRGVFGQVKVRREVILCAGAIQSPQILELSGIGDAERLRAMGLAVIADLPAVGENLSDHFHVRVTFRARGTVTVNDLLRAPWRHGPRAWLEYRARGTGLLASPTATAHALARTDPAAPHPDMKFQLHLVSSPDRTAETAGADVDRASGLSIGFFQLYPQSRGSVHLASQDPAAAPRIAPNYLRDPADRQAAVRGLRWVRRIAAVPALARFIVDESRPGPAAETDEQLLDHARSQGQTSFHPVGTCRMGRSGAAVVDPHGRVHGVGGVRVADASVMPFIVSSNINAPSIAVGERIADLILAERNDGADRPAAA